MAAKESAKDSTKESKDKEKAATVVALADDSKANTKKAAASSKKAGAEPTARAAAEAPAGSKETPAPATDHAKAAAAVAPAALSDKPSDKDIAREAWRRNLPDISSLEETKASILIPIKGSIEGATYHVNTKPKSVIINLPKADPLITMRFYKIRREGLSNLWIKQDEREGTTLKLMLNEATSPTVEIKDDFVRITVHKPADLPPAE